MAKVSIDEFVVELSLQETVTKGLAKLEKQIVPFVRRIEQSLNKAFSVDGSAKMSKTFTRIVKDADSAAKKINRSLTSAFDIKKVGGSSLRTYEKDANTMARRIAKEIKKAYDIRDIKLPKIPTQPRPQNRPVNNGSGSGGSSSGYSQRPSRKDRINENIEQHYANNTRNGMTNSMTLLGMHTQRDSMISELRATADRFRADPNAKYSDYLRASRDVIFSYKEQVAAQRRANRETERAAFMQHSLQDSTLNLVKGFTSIYTALEFFNKALDEGSRRTQAHTMAVVAYGNEQTANEMTMRADDVANRYGMDTLDTRESMAKMRLTLPRSMTNDDIANFFENESVFAHISGMSRDDVGRLNYVIPQIAASQHLMGQDFNQLSGASPALVQRLEKITNTQNVGDLKQYAKGISGSDFVKLIMQALEVSPEQKRMAQENIMAARGRMSNSVNQAATQFFTGFESGIQKLIDSVGHFFEYSSGNFRNLGKLVGFIASNLANVLDTATTVFTNIDGYLQLMKDQIDGLRQESPLFDTILTALKSIAGTAVDWVALIGVLKLIKSFAGIFLSLSSLGGLGKKLAGGAAAVGGAEVAVGAGFIASLTGAISAAVLAAAPVLLATLTTMFIQRISAAKNDQSLQSSDMGKAARAKADHHVDENPYSQPMYEGSQGEAIDKWISDKFGWMRSFVGGKSNTGGWDASRLSPSAGQMNMANMAPLKPQPVTLTLDVSPKGTIDMRYPDGYVQKVAVDTLLNFHESQMTTTTGSGGSWQSTGNNAGFSPNSLFVKGK